MLGKAKHRLDEFKPRVRSVARKRVTPVDKAVAKSRPAWREDAAKRVLEGWYPGDTLKRSLAPIARAIGAQGISVDVLGTQGEPFAVLEPASSVPNSPGQVTLTMEEAKAKWSAITGACLFYGTEFRFVGTRYEHAVLRRHAVNRHDAVTYRVPQFDDAIQGLGEVVRELREVSERFSKSADIIERRFTEAWRSSTQRG